MVKLIYVLLDGVGDLPHSSLNDLTPLEAAYTPKMDFLARNGVMGYVYSVGKGIAPESDIAVFSMLGYRFEHKEYVGRGVIESIGSDIDFRNGDLALRGNFATIDNKSNIIDRRAGRDIEKDEAEALSKAIRDGIKLSDASFILKPTIGHRAVLSMRSDRGALSSKISNTDPAYVSMKGIGVAKPVGKKLELLECKSVDKNYASKLSAKLVNEFTKKSLTILRKHEVNKKRKNTGKMEINSILLRDAGSSMPVLEPMSKVYGINFACVVDMPVEIGIAKIVGMRTFDAGGINDYEQKANVVAKCLEEHDAVYVHIKGPDEFGHDGDAKGKKKSIEEIDRRFFSPLLDLVNIENTAIVISGDHSTPCIKKGHSDDPVPLLLAGKMIRHDNSARFVESYAEKGSLGVIQGYEILNKILHLIKS
ncbi:MAG: phosphoglycerate mutase [Thaumarchaeota archaeon]|nr:phosphoglycerate mutase [Nitrososphaerota archaeon]|tara:strand:+ start:184 stop:1446 length:1263 start_codon:yes stop_codon:yes gene_type:complete